MQIYYDHTEGKDNTRLHKSIVDAGVPVTNLERYTGADLLLSPLSTPKLPSKLSDALPHMIALQKNCNSGMLLQRKTGLDFVHSIPKLADIIYRMFDWTMRPWLVAIMDLKCNRDNMAVIDGKVTKWHYNAVQGALEHWQFRGGYYSILSTDRLFSDWINRWLNNLKKIHEDGEEKELFINTRVIRQHIKIDDDGSWPVLASFTGIGPIKAKSIWSYCGNSLSQALFYCSDPELWESGTPDGIGRDTLKGIHEQLEMPENSSFVVIQKEQKKIKAKAA